MSKIACVYFYFYLYTKITFTDKSKNLRSPAIERTTRKKWSQQKPFSFQSVSDEYPRDGEKSDPVVQKFTGSNNG